MTSVKLYNLKFLSVNVCCVKNKLNYQELTEFITKYDLICLTETKTDDCDDHNSIPGYEAFQKQTQCNIYLLWCNHHSGQGYYCKICKNNDDRL